MSYNQLDTTMVIYRGKKKKKHFQVDFPFFSQCIHIVKLWMNCGFLNS